MTKHKQLAGLKDLCLLFIVNVEPFVQHMLLALSYCINCKRKKFILRFLFQISEEDYICEPCNELLMRSINQQLTTSGDGAQTSGLSQLGRRQVCSICGRSIFKRQSHSIFFDNPSEEQRQINAVIQTRIAPRQVFMFLYSLLFAKIIPTSYCNSRYFLFLILWTVMIISVSTYYIYIFLK